MASADELLGVKKSASDLLGTKEAKPAESEMVPSYDPMGTFTGYYQPAPPTSAKPMPYGEQMKEMGRAALGYGKGAISQVTGTPGDVEAAARLLYNLGVSKSGAPLPQVSEEPYFKTTEERYKQLFGAPKTPGEKAGAALGEVFGLPTALGLGKKAGVKLAESLVGRTTETAGKIAREAEKLGFKLEPRQVRAKEPLGSPGFMGAAEDNQTLANRLASKATGVESPEINRELVKERLTTLGNDYNEIFNRKFNMGNEIVGDLQSIVDFEQRVRPADARRATQIASSILGKYEEAPKTALGKLPRYFQVDGNELQRLRSELSYLSQSAPISTDRRVAGQFVEAIDDAITRANKDVGKKLVDTNRKYAATKTLEDMIEKGTVFQGNISLDKLGDYVASNAYGFGSGTSKHPLTDLAIMGRELGIRGIFEGVQEPAGELSQLLSKTGRFVAPVTRTQAARAAQRAISGEEGLPTVGIATLPVSALEAAYRAQQEGKK